MQPLEKAIEKGISDADAQARQFMRRLVQSGVVCVCVCVCVLVSLNVCAVCEML